MDLQFMLVLMGKKLMDELVLCERTFFICASFSRKVLWLEVAKTNNDSSIIAGFYLDAVEKYGKHDFFHNNLIF